MGFAILIEISVDICKVINFKDRKNISVNKQARNQKQIFFYII